jgi:hypothetical protein
MVYALFFSQLALIALLWLCGMLHGVWPSDHATEPTPRPQATPPRRTRHREPKPVAGLTRKPPCDVWAPASDLRPAAPSAPPPRLRPTRGRRRPVDTAMHCCPNPACASRGWVGWGNLRAQGPPHGGPWPQLRGVVCRGDFLETRGTRVHGTRGAVELIVRVMACWAEGVGIRGTARVFAVDPKTVRQGLGEAAAQLQAFSRHVLHDVRGRQGQLDELCALLRAVKAGAVREGEAIERLERMSQWGWGAMDPESQLLLAIDLGHRTLAMAPRVVQQVAQGLAPDCAPLLLPDGFRAYRTALLTH